MSEFFSIDWRRARKPHVCSWCHMCVVPGERYAAQRGKGEVRWWARSMHVACMSMEQDGYRSGVYTGDEDWPHSFTDAMSVDPETMANIMRVHVLALRWSVRVALALECRAHGDDVTGPKNRHEAAKALTAWRRRDRIRWGVA